MTTKYKIEMSYLNSVGGITNTMRVVNAGINDNTILTFIANLVRRNDPSLDFRVSRVPDDATGPNNGEPR